MSGPGLMRALSCSSSPDTSLTGPNGRLNSQDDPEQDRKQRHRSADQKWKFFLVIVGFMTISVFCLAAALILTRITAGSEAQIRGDLMCAPCKLLGINLNVGTHLKKDEKRKSKRGHLNSRHRRAAHPDSPQTETICCVSRGESPATYASFFSQGAKEEQFKPSGQSGCGHRTTAAHMFLNTTSLKGKFLQWTKNTESTGNTGHITGHVIYRNSTGSLEIMETAIYNVYSQITFRWMAANSLYSMFSHCLFRRSASSDEEEMIFCTQTTKMNVTAGRVMQPSHFQAAIRLNIGDTLFVKVSNITAVFRSAQDNYFGMYKLT